MKYNLLRKGLAFVVIVLFVGASIVPFVGSRTNDSTDDIGSMSVLDWPCDPDIIVPDDYPTIQEAIDAAESGFCIGVRVGTYYESIVVNKECLILCGENRNTTIIDGSGFGHIVKILGDNVKLNNFTIQNTDAGYAGIKICSDNISIKYNLIENCGDGIHLSQSSFINIELNIIEHCNFGVYTGESQKSTIQNNNLEENNDGIASWMSQDFFIGSNLITKNTYNGILLLLSSNFTIYANDVLENRNHGIQMFSSEKNALIENKVTSNFYNGITLHKSSNNNISENILTSNSNGTSLWYYSNQNVIRKNSFNNDGLFIKDSNNNSINENLVNGKPLVYYEGKSNKIIDSKNAAGQVILVNCEKIVIKNQKLTNSTVGIELLGSSECSILNNTIMSNSLYGIYSAESNDNLIYLNNFSSNIINARDKGTNQWDNGSIGNSWDDYTGVDSNGDGIGDTPYNIPGDNNKDNYPIVPIPPTVVIEYPNKFVMGNVTICGKANDFDGIVKLVEVKIDNEEWHKANGTSDWSYKWDTTTVDDGIHTISARCRDNEGTYSPIVTRKVVVDNTPPEVNIVKPKKGHLYIFNNDFWPTALGETKIFGKIDIKAEVRDYGGSGMDYIDFLFDNDTKETEYYEDGILGGKITYVWECDYTSFGKEHVIKAVAYDLAGNPNTAELDVTIWNIRLPRPPG